MYPILMMYTDKIRNAWTIKKQKSLALCQTFSTMSCQCKDIDSKTSCTAFFHSRHGAANIEEAQTRLGRRDVSGQR